jgi:hypothetical protein
MNAVTPHWRGLDVTLYHGDCIDVMRGLPDAGVDAVVTDPPYSLGFMGRAWDTHDGPAAFAEWCRTWAAECLRVLKPGGHLLAFGGTRTWHRLACGIEDAGFEIRDTITWLYACHDAQTEVLTRRGWVNGLDLKPDDDVAQWSTDGAIELVRPTASQRYAYRGRLVRFRNADVDQLVTPNHRVYRQVAERRQVAGRRTAAWSDWRVDLAGEINRWERMRLPAAGVHEGPGIGGVDYAALLGWVWAEGGFDQTGTGVRVYQSSVNADRVDEIAALFDRLGAHKRYDYQREWKGRAYTATTWFISGGLANQVRADLPGKTPTWSLLWRMTADEKRALWDAAMKGDGSRNARTFWQKDRGALEWAQALLAAIGHRGKVADDPRGALHWHTSPTVELQRRHLTDDGEDYDGEVWCVTVPSGALVVRRNGRVSVSGNSGFPKSLDVSKAIDKAAGHARASDYVPNNGNAVFGAGMSGGRTTATEPAVTDDARRWQGFGTALKPASEPVICARKPLAGTVAQTVQAFGTGALNIDACRVATGEDTRRNASGGNNGMLGTGTFQIRERRADDLPEHDGRWPSNVVLSHAMAPDGTDACADGCVPGCPVAELDAQSGFSVSPSAVTRGGRRSGAYGMKRQDQVKAPGDSGGASRFFPVFRYQAKASADERPRVGGVEHSTVKPLELMRWLVRLVTPPGGTVLEPFAGSGTTAEAAVLGGFACVAIEGESEYLPLIIQRLDKPLQPDLF